MSAVIRLKRHIDEEPYNAFVLNCKKRKVDSNSKEESSTVLKFAGTVSQVKFPCYGLIKSNFINKPLSHQDADINAHINRITKDEAREIISKTHHPDLTEKNRRESRTTAQNNRFKIVNCSRNLDVAGGGVDADDKNLTIVDVEKENIAPATSATPQNPSTSATDNFVYDLYIADSTDSFQSPEIIIDDIRLMVLMDDFCSFSYYITL
jgi:hypothetical protein